MRAEYSLICLLCLSVIAPPVMAEKGDREKPVNIEANTLKADDAKKIAIYEGKVILTQGTLMITADRLEVRQDDKGFSSGDADGKPAYFRQKMDPKPGDKSEAGGEYAEGWADRIEYDGRGDKLKLLGQARLKRGEEELRGNLITYDGSTEYFQAQGSISGSPGRVKAVIRPKNNPQTKP